LAVFKSQRASTKFVLLCSLFVGSIILATYSLIEEKQIAISFVRKELVGTEYLEALRGVYAAILVERADVTAAYNQTSIDSALKAIEKAEADTAGSLDTAQLADTLADSVRKLPPTPGSNDQQALIVEALNKARDLADRIGDGSNLILDPGLDSYYVQYIVVKNVPALFSQLAELQQVRAALATSSAPSDDLRVRHMLLDGMVRSTIEDIQRNAQAAYRGGLDGDLKQAISGNINSMVSAVSTYLEAANAATNRQASLASLAPLYSVALQNIDHGWGVSLIELNRLLNKRLTKLLGKLRSSLLLISLVAGLSLLFAAITYLQIVRPLRQLEELAIRVRETKDYGLRTDLVERQDEIGQLAGAFNAMLTELSAARDRETADQARNAAMQAELAHVARVTTMGEMAATIAHEINQPLAAVVNNANAGLRWLNNQPPNVEEVQAALKRIANDGERGSGIIDSIRAMLKKGDQSREPLDLNNLIFDVMRLSQGQFQRHGIAIRSELADELPNVMANRVQLQQVFLNLLMNAVEAILTVSDREHVVCVRSRKHDDEAVLIAIEDTGPGIGPDDAKRVFEAFFTTKPDGMGMGLSICRSIVESHGGRILVSKAGQCGSVFEVILPSVKTTGAQ
jgi:signal transduction histidine kinase